jgi:hypothetical protein
VTVIANYDSIDLDFSWDGDFFVGNNGDIADTKDDFIRSLENEIQTVVKSETLDWEKHPTIGATLSDFQGEPNTRAMGQAIEQRVVGRILDLSIVNPSDLAVRVVPVHIHQILIVITITAVATNGNRLEKGEPLVTSVLYDSSENSLFFLADNTMTVNSEV